MDTIRTCLLTHLSCLSSTFPWANMCGSLMRAVPWSLYPHYQHHQSAESQKAAATKVKKLQAATHTRAIMHAMSTVHRSHLVCDHLLSCALFTCALEGRLRNGVLASAAGLAPVQASAEKAERGPSLGSNFNSTHPKTKTKVGALARTGKNARLSAHAALLAQRRTEHAKPTGNQLP